MSTLSCLHVIVLAAPLVAAPQQPVRVQLTDQQIPLAEPSEDRKVIALRIVDGISGEPLAGAEVFAVPEQRRPLPAEFVHNGSAIADADGFAQLPVKAGWVMARAPGFGPGMDMDQSDRVFPLTRGLDVPVRVEDWRGAPLAGYLLGFCGGCGHTCDLTTAITDGDGCAVFRCVDPGNGIADLYVHNAPIDFEYYDVRWQPHAAPVHEHFGRGVVLSGTILDADGAPAAGALVGIYDKHRGPWSKADEHGRFTIGGIQTGGGLMVAFGSHEFEFDGSYVTPCLLRLPRPGVDPVLEGDPRPTGPTGIVRCKAHRTDGAEFELELKALGPLPGSRRVEDEDGDEIELVAGHYELAIRAPGCSTERRTVDVAAGTVAELAVELAPLPTVAIAVDDLPADATALLYGPEEERDITTAVRDGTPLPIDAAADYTVHLHRGYESRRFPATGFALLHTAPHFRWYRPTAVAAQLVDAHGAPAAADVALVLELPCPDVDGEAPDPFDPQKLATTACDGNVAMTTEAEGLGWLWVRPRDGGLRPRLLPVTLPWRGDDVRVDLGRIALAREPQLRLLGADGTPLRSGVALLRTGRADFREHCFHFLALAADGSWIGPDLAPGDGVLVPADDEPQPDADGTPMVRLPFRHVFRGDAGESARVPSGGLHVLVADEGGAPLAHGTVLMRECMWPANGQLRILQVPAGRQRLFVGATGHRTAVVDVELGPAEQRELRVVLPAR